MACCMADLLTIVRSPTAGTQLVQVEASTIPCEIEAGDLLRVDFDQHEVRKDGLYVVALGSWTGVRRFVRTPSGTRVLDIDRWAPVPASARILGHIQAVCTSRVACGT